jgi:hypothetical protein
MTLHIDDTGWPRVHLSYDGPLTMADVEAFQQAMGGYLDRGERFGVLTVSLWSRRTRQDEGPDGLGRS